MGGEGVGGGGQNRWASRYRRILYMANIKKNIEESPITFEFNSF